MAQDRIAVLTETWEPAIRDAFLKAVAEMRGRIDVAKLGEMVAAGDVEGAYRVVGIEPATFRPLSSSVAQAFEAGGIDATLAIKPARNAIGIVINPLFDVAAPQARAWIDRHNTDLIRQITEDQRALIREAMAPLHNGLDPMLTGQTPQKIALDLAGRMNPLTRTREGGLLGLTSQQAQWARSYEIELGSVSAKVPPDPNALTRALRDKRFDKTVAKAIREGKPLPAETRRAMVRQYRNRALRFRGQTIANHEALSALHQSQIEAWDQAIARGVVTEDKVRRFWITAGDEHVRETHRQIPGLNEAGVGLHEDFQTPDGPRPYPPIDPGCRCRVRVRVVG